MMHAVLILWSCDLQASENVPNKMFFNYCLVIITRAIVQKNCGPYLHFPVQIKLRNLQET